MQFTNASFCTTTYLEAVDLHLGQRFSTNGSQSESLSESRGCFKGEDALGVGRGPERLRTSDLGDASLMSSREEEGSEGGGKKMWMALTPISL